MQRIFLALAVLALLTASASAGCPGGRCGRPLASFAPTLAPRAHTHTARPVKATAVERSVVVRRHSVRGPGFFGRITFRPQARWR